MVPAEYGRYIEPFAGSACLFFASRPRAAVLADNNQQLIHAFKMVRERPQEVWRKLSALPTDKSSYYGIRSLQDNRLGDVSRAVRFIYLNRLCFNGVYRTNRQGHFNVPPGRSTGAVPSIEVFIACSKLLKHARLLAADFETTLAEVTCGDFVYLDPPYLARGRKNYGEYGYGGFQENDLVRLAAVLKDIDARGARFVLSYADTSEARAMFRRWRVSGVRVRRNVSGYARGRRFTREVIVRNAE